MTIEAYNALPKDVQALIDLSYSQYLKERRPKDPSKALFVDNIEWRVDSGLLYSGAIKKYNPQYDEEEEETPVEYLKRLYGIDPNDIGVDDESTLTNEEVDRLALKHDLDRIDQG